MLTVVDARRLAIRAIPALAVLFVLPACLPGLFVLDAGARLDQAAPPAGRPEIDLLINASGDDSIDVFLDGPSSDRRRIAEGVAAWLGFPRAIAHEHDLYPDTSTVAIEGRLIEPGADDEWVLDLDATGLARVLVTTGYIEGSLVICTPVVETRIRASEPSDLDLFDTVCERSGRGWTIRPYGGAVPPRILITLLPDTAHYLAYAAGVLLGTVLLGALAWWLASKLLNGPFRSRSAASVAIGLIAGGIAAIGLAAATAGAGALAGPADNLALARNLAVGGYASSLLFPALVASAPGILFATMLVRRRPSDDDGATVPGIAPPAPPGRPGPPPLPWNAG